MKKNLLQITLIVVVSVMVATSFTFKKVDLSVYNTQGMELSYNVPNQDDTILVEEDEAEAYSLFLGKTYVGFKEALGFKESRGDYAIINKYGYLGKYQFAKATLSIIGVHNPETFMSDANLQEKAFKANTSRNKWILRRDIKRFAGKYVGGVKVTESGILAAAHLGGAGNVKKYLRSGGAVAFEDAFGTSIRHYLKKFSGYDTSLIVPDKKARVL